MPFPSVKADQSPVVMKDLGSFGNYDQYVYKEFELENCSIFEDIAQRSPFVKFVTMCLAAFFTFCGISGTVICCGYCHLYWKYGQLQETVTQQTQEAGLPDDYEFDEDSIYMLEQERRQKISSRARQTEDGIIDQSTEIKPIPTKRSLIEKSNVSNSNGTGGKDVHMEEFEDDDI